MSKHIVIIGGGFAGINLAKKLGKVSSYKVTLVDKNNYNFFPPLLYQVSTGYLDPSSITFPFRNLFRGQVNLRFRMGTFEEVKPEELKKVFDDLDPAEKNDAKLIKNKKNHFKQWRVDL